jgi:CheY-like chemotaxis protein
MTRGGAFDAGNHVIQFYEHEEFLARRVAAFFAPGLRKGDPLVMIAAPRTLDMVVQQLALESCFTGTDPRQQIHFVDVDTALAQFMSGDELDAERFASALEQLFTAARGNRATATIWAHGEMVDLLCRQHNHAAAVRIEEIWNGISSRFEPIFVLCSYTLRNFDSDADVDHLRSVCRQHTHVVPTEGYSDAPNDRASLEEVVLLQQRVRAGSLSIEREAPRLGASVVRDAAAPTVYVIDDNASVRRSLARLLEAFGQIVRTFDSAEAFLTEVDPSARGCLLIDVHLVGMKGTELQSRLVNAGWPLPVIAMSGSSDGEVEAAALRAGAAVFLRKPFDRKTLSDAIARAVACSDVP